MAGYRANDLPVGTCATAARSALITLDRPERKNPLTFDSYAELRDLFRAPRLCHRHQGRGRHRRRRQFLLRRRRP